MKKIFAILIALTLCLTIGTGLAEEKTTLTVWCWDDAFNGAGMRAASALYTAEHPEVEVDVQIITDLPMVFSSAVLGQQYDLLPDIVLVQDRDLDKNVNLYNAYADLTDSGIDFSQFSPYKVQAASSGGRNYGIPFDNGVACYVFRSDLLEQAGYTAADLTDITWDRFIEIGVDVKEKLGIPMLKIRTDAGFTILEMMMQSAGSWYFNAEGALNITDNTVLREAIDLYLDMYDKGVIMEVSDGEQYTSAFYDGSVLGTINASWVLASVSREPSLSGKWAITNIPALIEAEGATNYSASGGCNGCVIETSPNKELAIDFLKETIGGGSMAMQYYADALDAAVVIGSYLPAIETDAYNREVEYFGNDTIYSKLVDYSANVPQINLGWYTTEARTAMATAIAQVHAGSSIEDVLSEMHDTLEFQMNQ